MRIYRLFTIDFAHRIGYGFRGIERIFELKKAQRLNVVSSSHYFDTHLHVGNYCGGYVLDNTLKS
jgi:hypothetical protein